MRQAVAALIALGPLPTDSQATTDTATLENWAELADRLSKPLSDNEARALATSFPADDSDAFGTAWTLVHLLESAPGWPIRDALDRVPGYWRDVLVTRLGRR